MATSELHLLDESLYQTNRWLEEIAQEMGGADRQTAYHALRGVLHTLRDRVTVEEAHHLAAQLPLLIRGIYFEGYRPANKPLAFRDADEFVQRVMRDLEATGDEARFKDAIRAVISVLSQHVTEGELHHVRGMLPKDIRALWPETVMPRS